MKKKKIEEEVKRETRGGLREKAKRPLKYGEETVMYWCRIPVSQKDKVDELVKKFIKKFEVKNNVKK